MYSLSPPTDTQIGLSVNMLAANNLLTDCNRRLRPVNSCCTTPNNTNKTFESNIIRTPLSEAAVVNLNLPLQLTTNSYQITHDNTIRLL